MAIIVYEREIEPGVKRTFYTVSVDGINRYTGKRVQKRKSGITNKAKAQHIEKELWSACREERPDGASIKKWIELIEQYIEHLYRQIRSPEKPMGMSPAVVRTKRSRINQTRIWDDIHIDLLTPLFVMNHLDKMESQGSTRSTTNHLLKEIKCIFRFGVEMGALRTNPFVNITLRRESKKRKEALNHQEANKLLFEAKLRGHEYYYIWLLTIALGLRRSELAGLQWIDVDYDQRLIYLRRQLIPNEGLVAFLKDREDRVVAIPQHIIPELKELQLKSKSEFVIDCKCQSWQSGHQARIIRAFCKEIGIKAITHHQLRATHITLALVDGIPLGIVKENVGHAKLSTTDMYFRSAGINMKGQTDGLKIEVPNISNAEIIQLAKQK